jgi:F-type H+-transporting ATPase subunit b
LGGLAKLGVNLPTLLAQIVNFAILFALLYLVAYRPIMRMLDERSRKVKEGMDQAELIKQKAAEADDEAKNRIETASKEGQELIAQAVKMGEEARQQAHQEARQEAETLVARARLDIEREREEAVGQLRQEFADLTILAAEKVIEQKLDKKSHRQLIDKVLKESSTLKKDSS